MAFHRYKEWLEQDNLIRLQGWARDGLTLEQISKKIGISNTTLKVWRNKYPAIEASIKKGAEVVDFAVEQALLKQALSGNITAQIFWLCNRRKDKWTRNPSDMSPADDGALTKARELLGDVTSVID